MKLVLVRGCVFHVAGILGAQSSQSRADKFFPLSSPFTDRYGYRTVRGLVRGFSGHWVSDSRQRHPASATRRHHCPAKGIVAVFGYRRTQFHICIQFCKAVMRKYFM